MASPSNDLTALIEAVTKLPQMVLDERKHARKTSPSPKDSCALMALSHAISQLHRMTLEHQLSMNEMILETQRRALKTSVSNQIRLFQLAFGDDPRVWDIEDWTDEEEEKERTTTRTRCGSLVTTRRWRYHHAH